MPAEVLDRSGQSFPARLDSRPVLPGPVAALRGAGSRSAAPEISQGVDEPLMFFRFGSALVLVVVISLLGIAVEKQKLELRREISRQHFRMDVLQDEYARLRLKTQQLAAVDRLMDTLEQDGGLPAPAVPRRGEVIPGPVPDTATVPPAGRSDTDGPVREVEPRRTPLLFFQQPFRDPRLENPSR